MASKVHDRSTHAERGALLQLLDAVFGEKMRQGRLSQVAMDQVDCRCAHVTCQHLELCICLHTS